MVLCGTGKHHYFRFTVGKGDCEPVVLKPGCTFAGLGSPWDSGSQAGPDPHALLLRSGVSGTVPWDSDLPPAPFSAL